MGDIKVARILSYGNEPQAAHRCTMPTGNIPVGTVAFCEDCGRYWRLAEYRRDPGFTARIPKWYELGMFGTWWYVRRRGTPRGNNSPDAIRRR